MQNLAFAVLWFWKESTYRTAKNKFRERLRRASARVSLSRDVRCHVLPSFQWHSLCLPTVGWPGWVDLYGW